MPPSRASRRRLPLAQRRLAPVVARLVGPLLVAAIVGSSLAWASPAAAQAIAPPAADELGVITLVVGGLDTRSPEEPENTDVLILARIDVPNHTVRAVIVPRDLYVQIPGIGDDKITRAYDFGSKAADGDAVAGMDLVKQTVAANFGVEADACVLTTFDGFQQIVDALGGIDVENPYDLYDAEYPTIDYGSKEIFYPAGSLHLSGEQALEFARTRHQDSDDGRTMRQQLLLRAMLQRVHDPGLAARIPSLVEKTRDAVRTDLTPSQQVALAVAAPAFRDEDVTFTTLTPYLWGDTAPNGMWIYNGDWTQLSGIVQAALDGS